MTTFVYDAGALIAAEAGDRRMWLMHQRAMARNVVPIVPTPVITEVWRGPSASLARLLSGCEVEPLTANHARIAGQLLSSAPDAGAVDAVVAEAALRKGASVVTSDRDDLVRLADSAGRKIDVIPI